MSKVAIAKAPDLSFLVTNKRLADRGACELPLILMKGGQFN